MFKDDQVVDFAGPSFELPHTAWVRLEDAARFALQGKGLEGHGAYERAVSELELRLSEAAFTGIVRFRGMRGDDASRVPREIDFTYFSEIRGMVALGNNIHRYPHERWHDAVERNQIDPDWRDVAVERAGFVRWHQEMARLDSPGLARDDRDEIMMKARHGEVSPEQAEAWARDNGHPPFASSPDPALFDPMTEPFWTMAMTAAWIMWRTPEAVRENWNAYRSECSVWRRHAASFADGRKELGWIVDRRDTVSLFDTLNEGARKYPGPLMVRSPSACRGELWLRLRAGDVVATGLPHGRRARVVVPKHDWIDLDHFEPDCGGPDAIGVSLEQQPRYYDVQVPSTEVTARWEPMPPALSPNEEHLRRIAERSALAWSEPFWSVWHVISWIAFRDKDRLCRVAGLSDLRQIIWYEQPGVREPTPHRALHAALLRNQIAAFGPDGSKIPAEKWAFVDEVWNVECRFRRKEVLRAWTEPSQEDKRSAGKRLSDDEARQLIRDRAVASGGFVSLAEGCEILRDRDPSMKRDDARSIVKSVISNEKRGPRGPRRNSAR
jgi:hypothetical protein